MKSYEEMAQYVLECRDRQLELKRKKRRKLLKCVSATAGFCFAVLLVRHAYLSDGSQLMHTPSETIINDSTETTTSSMTVTSKATLTTARTTKSISTEPYTQTTTSPHYEFPPPDTTSMTEIIPYETTTHEPYTTTEIILSSTEIQLTESTTTTTDDMTMQPTTAPIKPWEEMTFAEKYFMCTFQENYYHSSQTAISIDETEDFLGEALMDGYDVCTDTYYHCSANVYKIKNTSQNDMIAVAFENEELYIYINYNSVA